MIAVVAEGDGDRHTVGESKGEGEGEGDVALEVALLGSSAPSSGNLLPHTRLQGRACFADGPAVGPVGALHGSVLQVSMRHHPSQSSGRFTVIIQAPSRLVVSQYWSEEERIHAASAVARAYVHWKGRKALKKLKRAEFKRRMAVGEVLDIHSRFVKQLDVLSGVWRAALRTLMSDDDDGVGGGGDEPQPTGGGGAGGAGREGEGTELVESIFPHLDSISQTSVGLHDLLHACNRAPPAVGTSRVRADQLPRDAHREDARGAAAEVDSGRDEPVHVRARRTSGRAAGRRVAGRAGRGVAGAARVAPSRGLRWAWLSTE